MLATGSIHAAEASEGWFSVSGQVTAEYWSNVHGGQRTGSLWNGLLGTSFTTDLGKLGLSPESCLCVQVLANANQNSGRIIDDYTGAFNPVSGIGAGDFVRVFNAHFSKSWDSGASQIKIGQLAIDDDFMVSDFAVLFSNSSFGAMPSATATSLAVERESIAFGSFPVATPGLFLKLKVSDSESWQGGIYYGGPGADRSRNHGFDYVSNGGVVLFTEFSASHSFEGKTGKVTLGASYHSGDFDPIAGAAQTHRGLWSAYAIEDLVLVADEKGAPKFGSFVRLGTSPQSELSVATVYSDAGFNWFGPLPSRKSDTLGLGFAWTHLSHAFVEQDPNLPLAADQCAIELTYQVRITDHWSAKADLQYLTKPLPVSPTAARENALVLGFASNFSF